MYKKNLNITIKKIIIIINFKIIITNKIKILKCEYKNVFLLYMIIDNIYNIYVQIIHFKF